MKEKESSVSYVDTHPGDRDTRVTIQDGLPLLAWQDPTGSGTTWQDLIPLAKGPNLTDPPNYPIEVHQGGKIHVSVETNRPMELGWSSRLESIGRSPDYNGQQKRRGSAR